MKVGIFQVYWKQPVPGWITFKEAFKDIILKCSYLCSCSSTWGLWHACNPPYSYQLRIEENTPLRNTCDVEHLSLLVVPEVLWQENTRICFFTLQLGIWVRTNLEQGCFWSFHLLNCQSTPARSQPIWFPLSKSVQAKRKKVFWPSWPQIPVPLADVAKAEGLVSLYEKQNTLCEPPWFVLTVVLKLRHFLHHISILSYKAWFSTRCLRNCWL